jgi:hypothetical protein
MTAEHLAFVKGQMKGGLLYIHSIWVSWCLVEQDMAALEAGDVDLQHFIEDLRARIGKIRLSKRECKTFRL